MQLSELHSLFFSASPHRFSARIHVGQDATGNNDGTYNEQMVIPCLSSMEEDDPVTFTWW